MSSRTGHIYNWPILLFPAALRLISLFSPYKNIIFKQLPFRLIAVCFFQGEKGRGRRVGWWWRERGWRCSGREYFCFFTATYWTLLKSEMPDSWSFVSCVERGGWLAGKRGAEGHRGTGGWVRRTPRPAGKIADMLIKDLDCLLILSCLLFI